MVPQLIARVDGLPLTLLDREVVWPVPDVRERARLVLSTNRRARIERQTAVVREPAWARTFAAARQAEDERLEIRDDLPQTGLL